MSTVKKFVQAFVNECRYFMEDPITNVAGMIFYFGLGFGGFKLIHWLVT